MSRILLSKEQEDLLNIGHIFIGNGGEIQVLHLPYYYVKNKDNSYSVYTRDKLPPVVKELIEKHENRNTKAP